MQLELNEQKQADVLALFDELDQLTRGPFAASKGEIDQALAKQCGVTVKELRPWHYHDPFFQELRPFSARTSIRPSPRPIFSAFAASFTRASACRSTTCIERSDLYEKPGKSPHAFCTDIDREGDVRVLANIVPTEYWMGTMLHELGHAVYSSKNIPRSVPYVLRSDAHILCTEGVAMMFERFSKSAEFLSAMGVKVDDPSAYNEAGAKMRRAQLLIFSRWCQVMLRFEVALYGSPGEDLNKLWWDLVEKYQLVHSARAAQSARLRQQDPRRLRAGLLSQLHDGAALRLPGSSHDLPGRAEDERRAEAPFIRATSASASS